MLFVVCCLLRVGYSLLCAVCCSLFDVCCLLVAGCVVFVVCCGLSFWSYAVCWFVGVLVVAVCRSLFVAVFYTIVC